MVHAALCASLPRGIERHRPGLHRADRAVLRAYPGVARHVRTRALGPQTASCACGSAQSFSLLSRSPPTATPLQSCCALVLCGIAGTEGGEFAVAGPDRVPVSPTGCFSVAFLLSGSRRLVSET